MLSGSRALVAVWRGSRIWNVVPVPFDTMASIVPACETTIPFVMKRPRPSPAPRRSWTPRKGEKSLGISVAGIRPLFCTSRTTELGWQPRYDFAHVLDCVGKGDDFRSPLAQAIGSKGYHDVVFEDGPYPT